MVGGGPSKFKTETVEVISLDPTRHPVPDCLKNRASLPSKTMSGMGGVLPGGDREFSFIFFN